MSSWGAEPEDRVFLLSIPLLRGRWRPRDARRDEQQHEAMVAAELAKLRA